MGAGGRPGERCNLSGDQHRHVLPSSFTCWHLGDKSCHSHRLCSEPVEHEVSLGSPLGTRPDAGLFPQNLPLLLLAFHKHMMSPQPSQEYEFLVPFQQVLYKKTIEAFTRLYPPYLLPRPLITTVIGSSHNYSLGNRMLEYLAKSDSLPAGLPFYKLSNGKAFTFFLGQPNQSPEKGKEFLEITHSY